MADEEPAAAARPLWKWIGLAIAPGLACDALGLLALTGGDDLVSAVMIAQLFVPLVALFYLIFLGRAYVDAGLGQSVPLFVIGYGCVNALLWGAGCGISLSTLEGGFH